MVLENVRVREGPRQAARRWEGGKHKWAGPALPGSAKAKAKLPPIWNETPEQLRGVYPSWVSKNVQRHGNGPLAPLKLVSQPVVGSGGEAVGGQSHLEPWQKRLVAMSGRSQEERGSASGKQGPRHPQKSENLRRDGLGWSGSELAHLLIKLSLQTGLTTEGISVT